MWYNFTIIAYISINFSHWIHLPVQWIKLKLSHVLGTYRLMCTTPLECRSNSVFFHEGASIKSTYHIWWVLTLTCFSRSRRSNFKNIHNVIQLRNYCLHLHQLFNFSHWIYIWREFVSCNLSFDLDLLQEGLLIAFSIRLPGKLSSRHTVGPTGCQISMTHFLMFPIDMPTHSQINNSCLKIYPWQNTHLRVTAHPKRGEMWWAHHRHSSSYYCFVQDVFCNHFRMALQ
jgi:hypothetical protein